MYNLTFEFSLQKLVHAIAYFSESGVPDLTKLKVAKLIYFADKQHLLEHGQPIIGDVYFCMDYGPVPSLSLNEMSLAITGPEVQLAANNDGNLFNSVLNVKGKTFYRKYAVFEAKQNAYDCRVFSESEIAALRYTANVYGQKSAGELVNITHSEPTWIIPNIGRSPGSRASITYDLFFEGATEASRRFLGKLVADQYGVAIPLAGDADYAAFAKELADYDFTPDEIPESDVRSSKT
jgi:uncharacterized phage-associated protein